MRVMSCDAQIRHVASIDACGWDRAHQGTGHGCTIRAPRTYAAGGLWQYSGKSLTPAHDLNVTNEAQTGIRGHPTATRCATAQGVHASGDAVTRICGLSARGRSAAAWATLRAPKTPAHANLFEGEVVVDRAGVPGWNGLALALCRDARAASPSPAGFVDVPTTGRSAIAVAIGMYLRHSEAVTRTRWSLL